MGTIVQELNKKAANIKRKVMLCLYFDLKEDEQKRSDRIFNSVHEVKDTDLDNMINLFERTLKQPTKLNIKPGTEKPPAQQYILEQSYTSGINWYLCSLEIYPHEDSNWVLGTSSIMQKSRAMKFVNKEKAKLVAKILREQYDEYGCCSNYKVVKL